jgi:glycosyltransferase involved in cell wall biosynthesis
MMAQVLVSPTVSVVMCTYNGIRFLKAQLESIGAQTHRPDELVVCDDGSQDGTLDLLHAFRGQSEFPVCIFESEGVRLGSTKNFERAIRLSRGDIISLADQDDIWEPQKISVLQATLQNYPEAGYVFSDAQLIGEDGAPLRTNLWDSIGFRGAVLRNFSKTDQVAALLHRSSATGATMAFRSSFKKILLPMSPHFVHDYWISLILSCLGFYGIPVSEQLIKYRRHPGQQVGVSGGSLTQRLKVARGLGILEPYSNPQGFSDMVDRLALGVSEGWIYPAHHMTLVEEKLQHCSQRALTRSTRGIAKLGRVLSEVTTGRYTRYSNSWRSVVKDLCF